MRWIDDKNANWSSNGLNVAGSTNSVVPFLRHVPSSGSAIRFPKPRLGR